MSLFASAKRRGPGFGRLSRESVQYGATLAGLVLVMGLFGLSLQPAPAYASTSCVGYCNGNAGGCWCDSACETYHDCCSDYRPVCYAPQVMDFTPTTGPTAGGAALTVSGGRFTDFPSVSLTDDPNVVGTVCPLVGAASNTQFTCTVPVGQGTSKYVRVVNVYGVVGSSQATNLF